jgi:hypothetical protein
LTPSEKEELLPLSAASATCLADLRHARDRVLAAPLDRRALDIFARTAATAEGTLVADPELSPAERAQVGRVGRGSYAAICAAIASGRADYTLVRGGPDEDEDPTGPVQMVLTDGTAFDAAGFVRRLTADWERAAGIL